MKARKVFTIILALCMVFTLSIMVLAKTSSDSGSTMNGSNCSAYLNVHDDYQTYIETNGTRISVSDPDDFVWVCVSFDEYNGDLDADYEKENDGPNYTTVSLTASGYNPDSVEGSHIVCRNWYFWYGYTEVVDP